MDVRGSSPNTEIQMQNVHVKRYANPQQVGWAGYLEPEDRSWIAFIDLEGRPVFFLDRDPKTGAVCSSKS
jgi:hypothetical protein